MKKVSMMCKDIGETLEFIESALEDSKLTKRDFHQALLVSEEIVAKFQEMAGVETYTVTVSESFGEHSIIFAFPGSKPFELDDESEDDFGGKILRYYGEKIKYRYRSGVNTVTFVASQSFTRYLRLSGIAFIVSLLFCGVLNLTTSQETCQFILTELIYPIEGIFAKAVCMLATPVTFFCIVSNIANYSNQMDRYPDVRKLIVRYIATSVIAISIGYGIYLGIRPLAINFGTMEEFHINDATTLNFSTIWNALEFMVPDNILSPFIVSDTLPMLFLATISGISVGIIDRQSGKCREFVDMIRGFFCKMLYIVFDLGAVMVFFCFTDVIIYNGWGVLPYLLYLILIILLVLIALNLFYFADLLLHRIRPQKLSDLLKQCFYETFMIGSSVDAIPNTIRRCNEKLELPQKPLEVSIPLGANMNMDGNCAVLMLLMPVIGLINGVDLTFVEAMIMGLAILMLSLGAPNQPGSLTVATMILLPQLGLSEDVITITLIVEIITCRILAASNVLGDVVSSKIVGEQERRRVQKQRKAQS